MSEMKTTKEKADVMLAFDRGEKIERASRRDGIYYECPNPVWDWQNDDYRIAEKPKEKIKMLCWTNGHNVAWRTSAFAMTKDGYKRFPAGDIEGEVGE